MKKTLFILLALFFTFFSFATDFSKPLSDLEMVSIDTKSESFIIGENIQSFTAKNTEKAAEKPPVRPAAPARPAWDTEWKSSARVADSQPQRPLSFRPLEKPAGAAFGKPPASVAERREAPPVREAPVEKEAPAKPEAPKRPFVPAIPADQQKLDLPGQTTIEPPKEAPWRIAGEVLHTYIICESADGCVWLIDKHAAHERTRIPQLTRLCSYLYEMDE